MVFLLGNAIVKVAIIQLLINSINWNCKVNLFYPFIKYFIFSTIN